ncbi:ribonuclease P protein component [Alkalihalophilus marmarensis]|uniref:Ribonuclease P protein component n=1 Tax=Alkalihalophilus marmarensis DSM 21297 TaxID=1188261 RepID=U6SKW0_9BACI|nr:ribonuclease P protein component [Alkalihalophilus marmarensis]ERN51555.1 ribonuclease P [Alkalihalophilus marmarensis DSM 21297]MCM3490818.1 ribonuclease P protein component [Alkalihalophilus marmarensis]MEC2071441.1 ribonuclease P protein component [Alkalihalophilus marmarensis]
MKKEQRIKKNEDFSSVFKKGQSVANRQFVLYSLKKEGQASFRIGLSVSKKVGNAVVRNRIKRYVRTVFQTYQDVLPGGYDFVVIARHPVSEMDFHQVESSLKHVMKKARLLKKVDHTSHK